MRLRPLVVVLLTLPLVACGPSNPADPPSPSPPGDEEAAATPPVTPRDTPSPTPTPRGSPGPDVDPAEVAADELGQIPVLMYHRLREDGGGEYDRTPDGFRAELEWLFDHGYVPVLMREVVDGHLDLPAGAKPVVLTFDDSPREHVQIDDDGEPEPDTALGILTDVAADYEAVDPVAVWSVLPAPFGGVEEEGQRLMRWLTDHGHELANHTCRHEPLRGRGRDDVHADLACGARVITDAVPDAEVRTFTLPLGTWPDEREWAYAGDSDEGSYDHEAILLVGSNPAPSPFHADFDPLAVPRIRTGSSTETTDFESAFWLERLESTGDVYVSDGDPETISFPADRADDVAEEFADRANPYDP